MITFRTRSADVFSKHAEPMARRDTSPVHSKLSCPFKAYYVEDVADTGDESSLGLRLASVRDNLVERWRMDFLAYTQR